ncbi:predicted protein [Plenodomus lingam JN3]|uniref:Predicted protein n=1 Tax=Leptosphaeria maculans (strain JN3 / isolate v23.1.3 / race Av1-4-5-6-7-8) TaxID=985895 RepID=E5R4Z6_LEPMJ|nr:predicted protein [Plenodomus lingam JN3]CBX92269.1 predicted protein [Plenodomus lingam JN3]
MQALMIRPRPCIPEPAHEDVANLAAHHACHTYWPESGTWSIGMRSSKHCAGVKSLAMMLHGQHRVALQPKLPPGAWARETAVAQTQSAIMY